MVNYDCSGHRNRVRKRLINSKGEGFEDYELLEFLLFSAHPRRDVRGLAKKILNKINGGLQGLLNADIDSLRLIDGVTDGVIASILFFASIFKKFSVIDLNNKASDIRKDNDADGIFMQTFANVVDYIKLRIVNPRQESLHLIYINGRGNIKNDELFSNGAVDFVLLDIRSLFVKIVGLGVKGLVIAHNHPSGFVEPSEADIDFTKRLSIMCEAIGVRLIDHIIVSSCDFFSFYKEGLFNNVCI